MPQFTFHTVIKLFTCAAIVIATTHTAFNFQIVQRASSTGGEQGSFPKTKSVLEINESVRSDKFTGGLIERATLQPGQPDIEITVNVPAFKLTLWQSGKEVKTYSVGVGRKDYPISISEREATEVIWNPAWIPPDSDWVAGHRDVKPGEVIKASDPRNPLGKLKIPLGYGYLIHQAAKASDLGNLVSHGCIRMLKSDLFDLAEKIVAARALPVSQDDIERAKRTSKTLVAQLDPPLLVDINYDTLVVEEGVLHLYPDVYEQGTNTVENLRAELLSSGVDASQLDDGTLERLLNRVSRTKEFAVSTKSIEAGRAVSAGRSYPLVKPAVRKRATARRGEPA
ncbi:MAG: L,D-transpeptidase [Pyrinomonadaceae bacterium]|nr:L,D-transpeptidase [Pyrinomonadaceae bacterium]